LHAATSPNEHHFGIVQNFKYLTKWQIDYIKSIIRDCKSLLKLKSLFEQLAYALQQLQDEKEADAVLSEKLAKFAELV
jgi:hypothetical protein